MGEVKAETYRVLTNLGKRLLLICRNPGQGREDFNSVYGFTMQKWYIQ